MNEKNEVRNVEYNQEKLEEKHRKETNYGRFSTEMPDRIKAQRKAFYEEKRCYFMDYLQAIDMKLKEKNITAKKMLSDLNYSHSLITQWRKGNTPSLDKIIAVAEYLNVPVSYLLGEVQAFELLSEDEKNFLKNYRQLDNTCKKIAKVIVTSMIDCL